MEHLWKNLPQLASVAAMVVVAYFLMRQTWQRIAKRSRANPLKEVREQFADKNRDRALVDAPPEVLRWHVELHESARDLKAEIDSKLLALQALILLAREEREKLEAALGATAGLPSSAERPSDPAISQRPQEPL